MGKRLNIFLASPLRSFRILLYKYGLLSTPQFVQHNIFGKTMHLLLPEYISTKIYLEGIHEPTLTATIQKVVKPGMCVIDIGAHFGYYSLLLSSLAGESGQVHSFEPAKETFAILRKNCEYENNTILNNTAVFSHRGDLQFNDMGGTLSAFNSYVPPKVDGAVVQSTYTVPCMTLDNYCIGKKPDFIKIDAENAEMEILKGMRRILQENRPIITMEVGAFDENNESKKRIEFLKTFGYRTFRYKGDKLVETPVQEKYFKAVNLLFLHSDTI